MHIFENENFIKQDEPLIPLLPEPDKHIIPFQSIQTPQESPTFPVETTNMTMLQLNHPSLRTTALPSSPILNNHQTSPAQPQINNIPAHLQSSTTNILNTPIMNIGNITSSPQINSIEVSPQNIQTLYSPEGSIQDEPADITYDKIEYNAEIFHTPQTQRITQNIRIEEKTPDSISSTQKTAKKEQILKRKAQALDRWLEVKSSTKNSKSRPSSRKSSTTRRSELGDSASQKSGKSGRSRSASKNRNSKEGLVDWINRRVTGYMIFQNSVDKATKDIELDDVELDLTKHMNSLVGKKWKSLTPTAKEEYKSIAIRARVDFKKELDHMENLEDFKDVYSDFIGRIKKVKKD